MAKTTLIEDSTELEVIEMLLAVEQAANTADEKDREFYALASEGLALMVEGMQ